MKMLVLCLAFFFLILVSIQDIKNRKVSNLRLFSLLLIFSLFFLLEKRYPQNILFAGIILFLGVILSNLHLLGGADSKLIAMLILVIAPHYVELFVFFLACLVLVTCSIYSVGFWLGKAQRSRGIPLIPAISLAGWMCLWLTSMDAHGLVS
ncbi:prepilin peptidase [Celerinatantimonas sp. MCCC 1A17872]|uniref:prepilin peptidase n=1 Tax=Celerinatantimonas sp. MCCC 1A17872 TaxID=3177514 RepID=UPI0038BFE593